MNTFEQVYKAKLKTQLEEVIVNRTVEVSNDIKYDPLQRDQNSVIAVIRTGPGVKSSTANCDMTTVSLNIHIICDANIQQEILASLFSLTYFYNSKWDTATINVLNPSTDLEEEKTFLFKPTFTDPFPLGTQYELRGARSTFKATTILMSVNVSYSANADLQEESFHLEVGASKYEIKGIIKQEMSSVPSHETNLKLGNYIPTKDYTSSSIVFNFTIIKSKEGIDDLHDLLGDEFWVSEANLIGRKTIKLYRFLVSVDIQTISVIITKEGGVKYINLTLSR